MFLTLIAWIIAFILFVPWLLIVLIPVGALIWGSSYCVLSSTEGIQIVQKEKLGTLDHKSTDFQESMSEEFVYSNAS